MRERWGPPGVLRAGIGTPSPPTKTVKITVVCVRFVLKTLIKPIKIFLDIPVNLGPPILYKPCISHIIENFLPQKIRENSMEDADGYPIFFSILCVSDFCLNNTIKSSFILQVI